MNLAATIAALNGPLGGHPLLKSIRDTLTAGPQRAETVGFLIGLAASLLLIIVLAHFFGRERRATAVPRVDYLTLAVDLLGLSESDRRDLRRIARQAGLEQPAAMLLSPANLAHAATPLLRAANDGKLRRRIEQLSARLFDAPLPTAERLPPKPA